MNLAVVVVVGSALALVAGTIYTLRWFMTSDTRETAAQNGHRPADTHHAIAPHDQATTQLLRRFFDGKDCAICKRAIPPVHRTGLKPGLMDLANHEAWTWDEIPNENLSETLDRQSPICSTCLVAESFRQRFPEMVVDRERRVGAES